MDAQQTIKEQVSGHPVVLYMKGTPQFPQCSFSANARMGSESLSSANNTTNSSPPMRPTVSTARTLL